MHIKRLLHIGALLSLTCLLAACGHRSSAEIQSQGEALTGTANGSCRPVSSIMVTEGTIEQAHTAIGDITATVSQWTVFDATPTKAMLDAALKEKANEVCADAVVQARYGSAGVSFTSWGSMEANGRAVKLAPIVAD